MNKSRWLGSVTIGLLLLTECANPSLAALNEGDFVPCSMVISQTDNAEQVESYRIRRGDTLWDISNKYKVKLQTLMQMNRLDRNSVLTVGDILKIPSRTNTNTKHIVKRGETMWDIANHYQISVQTMIGANPNVRPNRLQIGDQLVIPDKGAVLAAVSIKQPSRGTSTGDVLSWPVVGRITSGYGWRQSGFHHGVDIAADIGTPIRAAAAGQVMFAGYKDIYGRMVVLKHPDGKQTVYAHAQKIMVRENQQVSCGQIVATIGVSGRTTGPHLHFEVKTGNQTHDPLSYLRH
ncbi:MAG: M23 family metallopeptidase [Bacillota bacterium]|nr:M23 family metallopeptidase [Bacillota bacterium]